MRRIRASRKRRRRPTRLPRPVRARARARLRLRRAGHLAALAPLCAAWPPQPRPPRSRSPPRRRSSRRSRSRPCGARAPPPWLPRLSRPRCRLSRASSQTRRCPPCPSSRLPLPTRRVRPSRARPALSAPLTRPGCRRGSAARRRPPAALQGAPQRGHGGHGVRALEQDGRPW